MNKDNPIAVLSKGFALRIVKLEKYLREEKKGVYALPSDIAQWYQYRCKHQGKYLCSEQG